MSTVVLTKWGNSVGIRIPSVVLKKSHLAPGVSLEITANKKGGFTLVPIDNQQSDWEEKFNAAADQNHDVLLMDVPNSFDEEEWTW